MPFETDLELEVAIGVVVAVAAAVVVVVPWALDDATWFAAAAAAAVDVAVDVDAVVADEQLEFVAASTLEAVVAAFEAVEVVAVIDLDPW